MKNFDRLIVPGCEDAIEQQNARNTCTARDPRCDDPVFAQANPSICGIDPRCIDPSFSEAHPEICGPSTSTIVLKPSVMVLCKNKSVQLHTFIRLGTNETEITTGLTYRSSNQEVALVGAIGGNVSGISEGEATISVEWLGKRAYSQIQVKPTEDCCEDISNRIVIVADISQSMSVAFGGLYASKLGYAKAAAAKFINGVDYDKDAVSLYSFSEAATQVRPFSTDKADLLNAVTGLATTAFKTNIYEGLEEAIQAVNAAHVAGARKVIVLISDFENKLGGDPVPLAEAFFESGGIIIAVGVRANGAGYVLGNRLATGGFFINSYPAVVDSALSALDGVKAYFCSGTCIPDGDTYASRAQLNYSSLINWDVPRGKIDLVGSGSDGFALYDVIPGHGLYLDLAGSGPIYAATIVSKQTFQFEPGNEYRLTLRMAGNQRLESATGTAFLTVGDILVDDQIDRTWAQNFTDEVFTFSVAATTTGTISIRYEENFPNSPYGFLLDVVKLENLTTGEVILFDDFDNENLQYIPPGCGQGTIELPGGGYAYGYEGCNNTDCLNIPPDTQKADPIIAPDVEDPAAPTVYTSTKSATVSCPSGTTGSAVTKTATATSIISQSDADTKATAAATELATAALVCTRTMLVGDIISIAFHYSPVEKSGFAAIGSSSSDFWNSASQDRLSLKYVDGVLSPVVLIYDASWSENYIPTHPDKLMQTYAIGLDLAPGSPGDSIPFNAKLGYLTVGTYDIYVYAHGTNNDDNATFMPQIGSYNEGTGAFVPDTNYEVRSTENGAAWRSGVWVAGNQYVKFSVALHEANKWVRLLQTAGSSDNYVITGIQIVRTGADQDSGAIAINDFTTASPYPSTKFISGLQGKIATIKLNIFGLTHTFPDDINMVLVGPDGTHVMIMSDAGGGNPLAVSNVDLVFDDAGAAPDIPDTTQIVSGTYKTHDYPVVANAELPSPCPPGPHSADLQVFVGKIPNGAWKLYVNDDSSIDAGSITNWTLTITTDAITPPLDADVQISVVDSPDPVSYGDLVAYAVTITNNGPNTASAVTLTVRILLPAQWSSYVGPGVLSGPVPGGGGIMVWSVNVGSMVPGAVIVPIVRVKDAPIGISTVDFAVSATQTDLTPGNNSVSVNTTVIA